MALPPPLPKAFDPVSAPVLVMVAPNGARRTQADHPALPQTVDEIARCAAQCFEAGAGAVHAHVRDAQGRHVLDAERCKGLLDAIAREAGPEMAVQITTEAVGRYSPDEQRSLVRAVRPRAVSIALREMLPDPDASSQALTFYAWCRREAIAVQHILYTLGDLDRLLGLLARGDLPDGPTAVLVVLGRYTAGQQSRPHDLLAFLDRLAAPDAHMLIPMVCAFGRGERAAVTAGLGFGLGARVGFENSIVRPDGAPLSGNQESVAAVSAIARTLGYTLATGAVALSFLGG